MFEGIVIMIDPVFSIVIPCYNSAAYISDTLLSLANQEYKDFEVIVVDDHSNDDSVAVAATAIKKYNLNGQVIVRPHGTAKGVANCRNLGIQNAKGAWVSFLDSDDLFAPAKLAGTFRLIQKYGETCYAFHHGIRQFEDGTNKMLFLTDKPSGTEPKNITQELTHKNTIATSSVTIKKSLLEELGGFDKQLHGVEDYLLWVRVSKKTKWFYSGEIWTDYRVRGTSLMGGREFTHYITQNTNLLRSAIALNEFSAGELATLEHSLFEVMEYYAQVSLNTGGWGDLMQGLAALSKAGKISLALRIFKRHLKNLVLKKLHKLKPNKKPHP